MKAPCVARRHAVHHHARTRALTSSVTDLSSLTTRTCGARVMMERPRSYGKPGRATKCSRCDKGSHACVFCGTKTTHTASVCKDCHWGPMKEKCVSCKTAKAVHLANVCDGCKKKGCMFCGKPT